MRKSWLEFYAYAVSAVAIFSLVVTLSLMLNSLIGVISPEFGLPSYEYKRLSANEYYVREMERRHPEGHAAEGMKRPSPDEITALREAERKIVLDVEKREKIHFLISSGIFAILSAFVLWIHACIACKERKRLAAESANILT